MTLLQLSYIIEIASTGSINKASKNMFVSQSCISSAIRELEEEIGIRIFFRTNRGVEFTDEGREFYLHIRPIVEQQQKVLEIYTEKSSPSTLRLSISTQHNPFSSQAFVRYLKSVESDRYMLRIKEAGTSEIIDEVASLQSDIGILFLSDYSEKFVQKALDLRDIEFTLLKRVQPHAFIGKHHPLATRKSIMPSDLEGYPHVIFDRGHKEGVDFTEEVVLTGFLPSQRSICVFDRNTIYNILAHSDAFSLGTGLVPDGFFSHNVTSVPIISPDDDMQLGWIRKRTHPLSAPAIKYIDLLKDTLEDA